jgi:GPH family glycoside/pentoside/hexuronide:cation symporter
MKKITNGKIFALCLGDLSRGLIGGIITTYLLTFFIPATSTSTLPQFFMSAALTMAIIRGVGTVVDAITDPWVASLSDNSKSPLGRRVSFMRMAAIPYGLFCLLVFFPPFQGTTVANAIWVGVMLILYYLFSTLYNIPYSALQAEIVTDPAKRVFLYTIVSLFYVISSALVFCTSMVKSMLMANGVPEIWALRLPFIVFCVLGAISALIPAFAIKEQDYVTPKPYHQSILGALKATASYPNFTIITAGYLIMWIAFTFFNTAEVYYITNLLALDDAWVTYVSVISIVVGIATYPLVNILARRVGKKPLLLGACVTYVLLYCAIYNYKIVIGLVGAPAFAILIGLVIAFPIAITNIIPASIFADLAQYDTIKTGQNRAGMFFAARNFANKLCQSIVVIVCALLLGTGTGGTGAATSDGIRNTALVAMIFLAISVVVYCFYNDKEVVRTIKEHTEKEAYT